MGWAEPGITEKKIEKKNYFIFHTNCVVKKSWPGPSKEISLLNVIRYPDCKLYIMIIFIQDLIILGLAGPVDICPWTFFAVHSVHGHYLCPWTS
jgi:hypothetical protein